MTKTILLTERFQATDEDPLTIVAMIDNGSYVPITELSPQFVADRLTKQEKEIHGKYSKLEIPPSADRLMETVEALKRMFANDDYTTIIDDYIAKVSEGFKSADQVKDPPKAKEKPKKADVKQERQKHKLTEHFWVYVDDPSMVMVTINDKDTAARFTPNEALLNAGLAEDEMLKLAKYRKLMTQVEAGQEWNNDSVFEIFPELKAAGGMLITKESLVKRNEVLAAKAKEEQGPAVQGQMTHKTIMKVEPGSSLELAKALGMPDELADLFFRRIDNKPYIMNPGLLYLANQKGKGAIQVADSFDEKTGTWSATTRIYPLLTREMIESIAKLDPSVQGKALEIVSEPTIGLGTANRVNVINPKMHPFMREMAQTRSQNRALRAYTGYGDTSAEEMPQGVIEGASQ